MTDKIKLNYILVSLMVGASKYVYVLIPKASEYELMYRKGLHRYN